MALLANDSFVPGTAMPDPAWGQALWPDPKQALAVVGIRADMEVVHLCCGDGLRTAPLALTCRHVIGIDLDP
jgi:hypothetical protein